MNKKRDIIDLVAEFEALLDQGLTGAFNENNFLLLIDYYSSQQQHDLALKVADQALEHYSFTVEFYLRKAELFLDTYQVEEAIQVLQNARIIAPFDAEVQFFEAKMLAFQGEHEEARLKLDLLKPEASKELFCEILLTEAYMLEQEEEYEAMFFLLKTAVLEYPQSQDALHRFGSCVELTKKYAESIELHQELLNADPYLAQAWYNLAQAQAYFGEYHEAIESYEFAIVIDEDFEIAYRDCADLCFEVKRFRKALKWYQEVLEFFEPEPEVYFKLGECHKHLGQTTIARAFFQQALQLDPFNDEVYYAIGCCYAQDNAWKQAIRSYNKAISIEDSCEEYFGALAQAFIQLDEPENVKINYQKAIDLAPEQPQYWAEYASFLLLDGWAVDAFNLLEEAELYTTSPALSYTKIACLFVEGRRQEAFYWLGEALDEDFQSYPYLFELCPELAQDTSVQNLISTYAS